VPIDTNRGLHDASARVKLLTEGISGEAKS
jgi:hypothetical protein